MARILWVPAFQPGSYFPAVPIALELAARGHELTVLCEAASEQTFESLGFAFRPARALDRYTQTTQRPRDREEKLRWHAGYESALFADVSAELAVGSYDAEMFDPLEVGAGLAAEAAGVTSCSYVHWRMDETGTDVPFSFHLWDRSGSAADAFVEWWNGMRALVGLPPEARPRSEHRWYRQSADLTLILGLPELAQPQGELPPYAVRVGPLLWDGPAAAGEVPAWATTLGEHRPAILASLSTVGGADAGLVSTLFAALADEELDVALTVPGEGDLPAVPANVRLARFVPHGVLLERVSLVVCHSGNGIVTRAACAGVPIVAIPDGRDRFEVARGAVAAGIAVAIDRADLDADSLRAAIRTVIDDPDYGDRAQAIAACARTYDARARAATEIETLLA